MQAFTLAVASWGGGVHTWPSLATWDFAPGSLLPPRPQRMTLLPCWVAGQGQARSQAGTLPEKAECCPGESPGAGWHENLANK